MRTRRICFASLLILAGCQGGEKAAEKAPETAPEKAPDCEATLSAAIDRMVGEAKRSMSGSALARIEANAPKLRQALHASCVADEWSAMALRCFGAATLQAELDTCTAKLTHEQYERVRKKIDPLLAPEPAPVAAPAPAPAPARPEPGPVASAGSGSGGSGSGAGSGASNAAGSGGRRPQPRPTAKAPAMDCSKVVVDPSKAECRRQYCRHHPDDLRCIEE